ncbi:GrpB domain, predicted nucleotidyltransferase, UPF0157 family [Lentibacillus persicus]|uniref:GrpB domain, predicted nucleotidyltransferase, UPF0157 family n=1 Tax=Lentibacillus persicus TaxID=640948 RepID=A0A1I1TMN8_9BACI|nr:GrpB family protein [Lentibacillus persicus]SFD59779.1 GrpB domain, predicted nucleotidyltransferase, UPF0157 family [Lentibacillus persicus]
MRKVEITPYNQAWPSMFEEEAKKLCRIFESEIIEIYHIGSTSVEGLLAKPIIDIMPVVRNIDRIDDFNNAMIDSGYEAKGENGLPGRRYFQKGGEERTHHIHFYEAGNSEIGRHLAFRDYLRSHPGAAEEYSNLKKELSQHFPYDIEAYISGKERLVSEIEKKAMTWYQRTIQSMFL